MPNRLPPAVVPAVGRVVALAAALALTGCAGWNNALLNRINALPPYQPAALSDKIDGNYKGAVVLAASQSPACPGNSFGRLEIGDQKLYFAYAPGTLFVGPVQPDGTIQAVSGRSSLSGTLLAGRLLLVVRTPICESHYDMRRVL